MAEARPGDAPRNVLSRERFAALASDGRRHRTVTRSAVDDWAAARVREGCDVDVYARTGASCNGQLVGMWRVADAV
jgi:hypothetical protein